MSRNRTEHWYQVESLALFLLSQVSQSVGVLASLLTSAPIRSASVRAQLYAVHERLAMLLAAQEGTGDIQAGIDILRQAETIRAQYGEKGE